MRSAIFGFIVFREKKRARSEVFQGHPSQALWQEVEVLTSGVLCH